ncbi:Short-chain-enoyl-CoA hydratase [Pseudocercospora fuligena]|uniref:Short-chain-enoyl-CoA hydratase n=1 Tax=Pseudocercospora fuligena TaxID=685502 RepID=A0A8H6R604_9PEZI|nr:Short-chain-enoyl-CoA hydratase [Pseudocercospora fuligena]
MNIVNTSILNQLTQTCQTLSNNENLRAVILTGSPTSLGKSPSFIGGADIKAMASLTSSSEARSFILKIHETCTAIRNLPVPVIAKINGWCLGAGLEIMASCDLKVATRNSVFAMPEVAVGIPSVVEAALLPSQIGMGRTRRLLYLAEHVSAEEAERWGLIEEVVDGQEELEKVVGEWIGKICGMGPKAIRSQKALMRGWERNQGVEEGIQQGVEAFAEAFEDGGKEPKEYMGKFLGRRR